MHDEMKDTDCDIAKKLLLPDTHPKYQEATGQLNTLSQILCTHIISNSIIDKESSPICYSILQANIYCKCGFDVLVTIIFGVSPQLGRKHKNAQILVIKFTIYSGEKLSNFCHRALNTQATIQLMQDKTGQSNKFVSKYIELLNTQPDLQIHMVQYNKD
eukprot:15364630-Ditylum_brightwellii.AAC.1